MPRQHGQPRRPSTARGLTRQLGRTGGAGRPDLRGGLRPISAAPPALGRMSTTPTLRPRWCSCCRARARNVTGQEPAGRRRDDPVIAPATPAPPQSRREARQHHLRRSVDMGRDQPSRRVGVPVQRRSQHSRRARPPGPPCAARVGSCPATVAVELVVQQAAEMERPGRPAGGDQRTCGTRGWRRSAFRGVAAAAASPTMSSCRPRRTSRRCASRSRLTPMPRRPPRPRARAAPEASRLRRSRARSRNSLHVQRRHPEARLVSWTTSRSAASRDSASRSGTGSRRHSGPELARSRSRRPGSSAPPIDVAAQPAEDFVGQRRRPPPRCDRRGHWPAGGAVSGFGFLGWPARSERREIGGGRGDPPPCRQATTVRRPRRELRNCR